MAHMPRGMPYAVVVVVVVPGDHGRLLLVSVVLTFGRSFFATSWQLAVDRSSPLMSLHLFASLAYVLSDLPGIRIRSR